MTICRSHSLWAGYGEFRAGHRTHVPWAGGCLFYYIYMLVVDHVNISQLLGIMSFFCSFVNWLFNMILHLEIRSLDSGVQTRARAKSHFIENRLISSTFADFT